MDAHSWFPLHGDLLAEPAERRAVVRRRRPRYNCPDAPCAARTGSSETVRRAAAVGGAAPRRAWRRPGAWRVSAQRASQRSRYAWAASSVSKRRLSFAKMVMGLRPTLHHENRLS